MERTPKSTRLAYQPALDGLRAVAVTMVLLFHGGVSWMRGGYFGVSMFFTLSGFLITSLLVREFSATRRIEPGAFYVRRAKRLLPASTVCIVVVSIMAAHDVWRGADHVRRDAVGALFQVANWVQLGGGGSYTDLQSKSAGLVSPLDHYWSLAIEEQFYWIWPLTFWGLAVFARRRGVSLTRIMVALTAIFAAAAPLVAWRWGRDAAYWATPARAAEILIGALLAVALCDGKVSPRRWMAPASLVAVVVIAVLLPAAGGPAYHGAFPVLAIASCGLVLGVQMPGPVTRVLSCKPLVALGAISYGVYLYHFPIFVFLSVNRFGHSGWSLLAARLAVTLVFAISSYWLIERPIRRAVWTGSRTMMHAAVAVGLVAGAILFVPTRSATYWTAGASAIAAAEIPATGSVVPLSPVGPQPTAASRLSSASSSSSSSSPPPVGTSLSTTTSSATGSSATSSSATTSQPVVRSTAATGSEPASTQTRSTPEPAGSTPSSVAGDPTTSVDVVNTPLTIPVMPLLNRPVRIIVVGDSTAASTGAGLVQWAALDPTIAKVTLLVSPGCGFIRRGVVPTDGKIPYTAQCNDILDHQLPDDLRTLQPDIVMLMTTIRDVEPRVFDSAEGALTPRDPRFVNRVRGDYLAITNMILTTSSAHVVWIKPPAIDPYWMNLDVAQRDVIAHSTMAVLMGAATFGHRDRVIVLDLGGWLETAGLAENHTTRPDGIHFDQTSSLDVATRWLGPELVIEATRTSTG